MVVGARRIRSKKLREHQYREVCARSLKGKGVEWGRDDNVERMENNRIAKRVYVGVC